MKFYTAALILATLPGFLDTSTSSVQAGLLPRLKPKGHLAFTRRSPDGSGNPEWTSKQDSERKVYAFLCLVFELTCVCTTGTLLAPDPPPEKVAQAREQNDQLAKQAYPNLLAASGGSTDEPPPSERLKRSSKPSPPSSWQHTHDEASSSLMRVNGGSASVSSKDSPYDKRAAMPQGKWKSTTKPVHLKAAAAAPEKEFDGGEKANSNKIMLNGATRGYARHQQHEARALDSFEYGKEPVRGVNIGGWLVCRFLSNPIARLSPPLGTRAEGPVLLSIL